MTTVLHATDSASFLALVPTLAGFTPTESVVLLPFHGRRCHGAMRLDLPHPRDQKAFARAAVELLLRVNGVDGAAIVLYSDTNNGDESRLPAASIVHALSERLAANGLRVVDVLGVTGRGWGSYRRPRTALHPLSDIPDSPGVMGIADVHGDQDSGAALLPVPLVTLERVGRTVRELDSRGMRAENPTPKADMTGEAVRAALLLQDIPALYEEVLDSPQAIAPPVASALVWCLNRPLLRDVALLQWATDLPTGRIVLDAQLAHAEGNAAFPDRFGRVLLGYGARPDSDRLRIALAVARLAAAHAPRQQRLGPLTIAAWLSWALGRTTHAAFYLDAAAEIDPGYAMAELVRTLISAEVLPEWAFHRADE